MKSRKFVVLAGICLSVLFFMSSVSLSAPVITFEKNLGGVDKEIGYSTQQTSDGGYIVAGFIYNSVAGNQDVLLMKTDAYGNLSWQKTFGGTNHEWGYSVQQTSDGGYIVAGITMSFGAGSSDAYLIKTDSIGNLLWEKTFGGTNGDNAYSVRQTSDGGYILAGAATSFDLSGDAFVYLVKTDMYGNLSWQNIYHYPNTTGNVGRSVRQTSDGYIIAGHAIDPATYANDVLLVKTDTNGTLVWQQAFGGPAQDYGYSVSQTTDSGYVIAGRTTSFGAGETDVYLLKTDTNGNFLWQKTYGGIYGDGGRSVMQTSDGGYIIAGSTASFGAGGSDVYLIKTDSAGNTAWSITRGGVQGDGAESVQQTTDGGYIVAGSTASYGIGDDVYLIKTNSKGR